MPNTEILFDPGLLLITHGALDSLSEVGERADSYIHRHVRGDWGEMDEEDKQSNDEALINGSRIFSGYQVTEDMRLWIITESLNEAGVRESTTTLLPSEY